MGRLKYSERTLSDNSILRLLQSPTKGRLGPLEWQVLSFLWQRGSATVKEVVEYGDIRREYNTVMTTLDRLYRKRLSRTGPRNPTHGRSAIFLATVTKASGTGRWSFRP